MKELTDKSNEYSKMVDDEEYRIKVIEREKDELEDKLDSFKDE